MDIAAVNRHRLNFQHKLNKVGFSLLFWGREAEVGLVVWDTMMCTWRKNIKFRRVGCEVITLKGETKDQVRVNSVFPS